MCSNKKIRISDSNSERLTPSKGRQTKMVIIASLEFLHLILPMAASHCMHLKIKIALSDKWLTWCQMILRTASSDPTSWTLKNKLRSWIKAITWWTQLSRINSIITTKARCQPRNSIRIVTPKIGPTSSKNSITLITVIEGAEQEIILKDSLKIWTKQVDQ